jgi:predicted kinase
MRQFDQRRLASRAASEGRLTPARCRELGRTIACFHNGLEPVRPETPEGAGTPAALLAAARQNFRQIDEALPPEADRQVLRELEQASTSDAAKLEPLMRQRLAGGFVRECHGDLHLDNIVLMDDRVLAFDCIEFNPDFRLIDIQCEIGFVVMDLDSRDLPDLANRVLNTWLEYTGDYAGLALHTFYDVYLAMVRAKISLFAALAGGGDPPDLSAYRRYLALAAAGRRRLPGFLCLMMGVSGSGKSTVAERLAARFSAIRLRSDVERKRLFDLAPDADSAAAGLDDELYREETSDRVFERLAGLADGLLAAGLPVVVDATFLERHRRRPFLELAARRGVPPLIVHCTAEEAELERRLTARRRETREASEAGVTIMRRQLGSVEPPDAEEIDHVLVVDTESPQHERRLASAVERRITSRGAR